MCQSLQIITHNALGKCFGTWARLITYHTKTIGIFYFLLYVAISFNMINWTQFEDEQAIWTPENNQSILNEARMVELYPDALKVISTEEIMQSNGFTHASEVFVMIEVKEQNDVTKKQTLFTVEMFEEMIRLEEFILNITSPELSAQVNKDAVTFYDLCRKTEVTDPFMVEYAADACKTNPRYCLGEVEQKCQTTSRPLDFVYDRKTDSYDLSKFKNDNDLIRQIQSGKGDTTFRYYSHQALYIEAMFAGTIPSEPTQDYSTGRNDLYAAKSARWAYQFENKLLSDGYTQFWSQDYEVFLQDQITKWGERSNLLNVVCFTRDAWGQSFIANVFEDLVLMAVSMLLIVTYSFMVLGGMSPILFRSLTAFIGVSIVALSLTCGYGIAFAFGLKVSRFHDILPFMIMGIGVDDMFVIVNTVDQTPQHLTAKQRFRTGLAHAGPSITITSVTNALAFFVGALSTLPAIRALCIFAGIIICTLYFGFLTIFSPWFYYDLQRQHKKQGDCCGLCMCKPDSILCCRGHFLTKQQRQFVGFPKQKEQNDCNSTHQQDGSIHQENDQEYSSAVEKFIATIYGPKILSLPGRITVLIVWAILLAVAGFGVSQVEPGFSMELFIPEDSNTDKFYQMDMKYFKSGFVVETIVNNEDVDYSTEESQYKLLGFYDSLQRCYLCEKSWFYNRSLNAWYPQYLAFVKSGMCSRLPEGLSGFQRVVPQDEFYPCLEEAMDLADDNQKSQLRWESTVQAQRKLVGFRSQIHAHRVPDASKDGVILLDDLRRIESELSVDGTFSYAAQFLDFEMWYTFTSELTLCLSLSIVVILIIILIITANVRVMFFVALCVGITDIFLFALIYYWGLTLNPIVLMHVIVSIGISVDYSAHIGYAYLVEPLPLDVDFESKQEIRVYKSKMALSKMGSSVFHGGFSTFIAILVLAPGTTYIFLAFFKCWIGIILFGMSNGFMFLPVILSFIGPVGAVDSSESQTQRASSDDDKESIHSVRTAVTSSTARSSTLTEGTDEMTSFKVTRKSFTEQKKKIVAGKRLSEEEAKAKQLKKMQSTDAFVFDADLSDQQIQQVKM